MGNLLPSASGSWALAMGARLQYYGLWIVVAAAPKIAPPLVAAEATGRTAPQ